MSPDEAAPDEARDEFDRPAFDVDELRDLVQKYFKVYEVERDIRGVPQGEIAAYYIQTDAATFNERFESLREEIRRLHPNLIVILQHRLGEDVLLVARKPPIREKGPTLNIVLLVLTILTTTLGGALFYQSYSGSEDLLRVGGVDASFLHPRLLGYGFLTFSLPLIFILGIHELGHYYVARRHHVRTSLPYFIPVPPIVPIGTFGAFISMKEPIPDRKALFDIGASGPIAGFLVAIPVLVVGMILTAVYAVPVPPDPEVHGVLDAPLDAATYGFNATAAPPDALYEASDSKRDRATHHEERIVLNLSALYPGGAPEGPWRFEFVGLHLERAETVDLRVRYGAPDGTNVTGDFEPRDGLYEAHLERTLPLDSGRAAYEFSLPANANNLTAEFSWRMPPSGFVRLGDSLFFLGLQFVVGQAFPVDDNVLTHPTGLAGWVGLLVTGFNLLPAGQLDGGHVARAVLGERMRWASYASVALMFLLAYKFYGWILMAILIVFLGLQHPPPLNDKSPLDARRRVLAALVLVILIGTFVPFPFLDA